MRGLIGDLLDAGRIDSGTLSVVAGAVTEVAALVDRARNTFVCRRQRPRRPDRPFAGPPRA